MMTTILPIEPSAEVDWLLGKVSYGRKQDVKHLYGNLKKKDKVEGEDDDGGDDSSSGAGIGEED